MKDRNIEKERKAGIKKKYVEVSKMVGEGREISYTRGFSNNESVRAGELSKNIRNQVEVMVNTGERESLTHRINSPTITLNPINHQQHLDNPLTKTFVLSTKHS
jgi:hypothetical protein